MLWWPKVIKYKRRADKVYKANKNCLWVKVNKLQRQSLLSWEFALSCCCVKWSIELWQEKLLFVYSWCYIYSLAQIKEERLFSLSTKEQIILEIWSKKWLEPKCEKMISVKFYSISIILLLYCIGKTVHTSSTGNISI